jgi:hypothetical protein
MNVEIDVTPRANRHLAEIREYYDLIQPGLGQKFLKRVDESFDRLRKAPRLYGRIWRSIRAARV